MLCSKQAAALALPTAIGLQSSGGPAQVQDNLATAIRIDGIDLAGLRFAVKAPGTFDVVLEVVGNRVFGVMNVAHLFNTAQQSQCSMGDKQVSLL